VLVLGLTVGGCWGKRVRGGDEGMGVGWRGEGVPSMVSNVTAMVVGLGGCYMVD